MKNVITNTKKGFLLVTMFATLISFANEVSFSSKKDVTKSTSLPLENAKEGSLLSIKNSKGIILYKEIVKKEGAYSKGFDLTSLPDGSYFFELDGVLEITTFPFTVRSGIVEFHKNLSLTTYKPVVRLKDNLLFVSRLNLDLMPVVIEVFFKNDKHPIESGLIYSETIEDKQEVSKIFKLSITDKGTYKVVIKYEGREFIEEFIIN